MGAATVDSPKLKIQRSTRRLLEQNKTFVQDNEFELLNVNFYRFLSEGTSEIV